MNHLYAKEWRWIGIKKKNYDKKIICMHKTCAESVLKQTKKHDNKKNESSGCTRPAEDRLPIEAGYSARSFALINDRIGNDTRRP